jgi:hypothetical protein
VVIVVLLRKGQTVKLFLSGLLSGALLISGCVVATKGSLAGMFLLGLFVGTLASVYLRQLIASLFWSDNSNSIRPKAGVPASNIQRAHAPKPVSVIDSREKRRQQKQARKVLSSERLSMLPLVQQEVLSALMNLGMPFKQAEQAVREGASQKSGESFDELFRLAVGLGRATKVAA